MSTLWTAKDIEQLPDDAYRYALIRGTLHRMPPRTLRHGRLVGTLGMHLGNFLAVQRLGVITDQSGFVFERDPDTLLGPDLAFVRRDRVPMDEDAYPELVPDLVVEVASSTQTGPSIEMKVAIYLSTGVRLMWVVDPLRRTIRVHRAVGPEQILFETDILAGEDVLPGFQLPVVDLFA